MPRCPILQLLPIFLVPDSHSRKSSSFSISEEAHRSDHMQVPLKQSLQPQKGDPMSKEPLGALELFIAVECNVFLIRKAEGQLLTSARGNESEQYSLESKTFHRSIHMGGKQHA